MAYTIVSSIVFALMIACVVALIIKGIFSDRPKRIKFIKNYKKGRFFLIYLLAYPLFLICFLSTSMPVIDAILRSVSNVLSLVVMKYDMEIPLVETNLMFAIAIYTAYVLAFLNAILFASSCLGQIIWDWFKQTSFNCHKKDKVLIIGNNDKNIKIYNSCKCKALLVDVMDKEQTESLFIGKIGYKACRDDQNLYKWFNKLIASFNKKKNQAQGKNKTLDHKLSIIINTDNDQKNLQICAMFVNFVTKLDDNNLPYVDIYVYGDKDYEDIYVQYEEKSKGCLHYINQYKQIALDFVDRYPLTKYLNRNCIDYSTSLVDKDASINVAMVGFGKTNQQIFLTMVGATQFISKDARGRLVNHQVHYHFLDKKTPEHDKTLNHCYYRYKHNFFDKYLKNRSDYLPLIDLPSHDTFHDVDVNGINFYDELRKSLSRSNKALNYIVVSLGKDHDNIDFASKITTKIIDWKLTNTYVFVKIKNSQIAKNAKLLLNKTFCHIFGTNDSSAFNYDSIVSENYSNMAISQDFVYTNEANGKDYKDIMLMIRAKRGAWNRKLVLDRESSTFACLALRSKLQMMGLDYVSKFGKNKSKALTEKEYLSIYARNDMPKFVNDGKTRQIEYTLQFNKSRRSDMAFLEHNRWSAFMIMKGFVPCTKQHIATHSKKADKVGDNLIRVHKAITTMDGLIELRKILAKANHTSEAVEDLIKYDYQILDNAYTLLNNNGFKIIKKVNA